MTSPLAQALDVTDMVVIDDLYAFEFELDEEDNLTILCMDGRTARRWVFTPEEVAAATQLASHDLWKISAAGTEHQLRLLEAFAAEEDEDHA